LFNLNHPLFNIFSIGGAIFVLTLSYYPYLTLFVLSGILSLDPSLEEAGRLSMDQRKVFMRITLPFIKPYVLAGLIIVFIFSTANYGVPSLLNVRTYPVEIFSEFSTFFNTDRAILSSFPFLCLITGFMVWHWWLMRKSNFAVLSPQTPLRDTKKVKHKILVSCLMGVVITISVFFPLFWLIWTSASLRSYVMVLNTAWYSILITLALATATATIAVMVSYVGGYLIVRIKSWKTSLLDLFSFLPLAIPGSILGAGMIKIWNHPLTDFIYGSVGVLILGYLAQFYSFSFRCLIPSINQISPSLEESYLICERNWFKRQKQIVFPLARQGFILAWILVFILCLGELSITLFIIPPGMETLSLRIYNLMHYGAYEIVAALSVILLCLTILPLTLLFWKRQKQSPHNKTRFVRTTNDHLETTF